MKTKFGKSLTREEMKNVAGGIGPDQVWVLCNVNGTTTREISTCTGNCDAHCTTGSWIGFAPGYTCACP